MQPDKNNTPETLVELLVAAIGLSGELGDDRPGDAGYEAKLEHRLTRLEEFGLGEPMTAAALLAWSLDDLAGSVRAMAVAPGGKLVWKRPVYEHAARWAWEPEQVTDRRPFSRGAQ